MTYKQIEMAYKSWKGSIKKRGLCCHSLQNLDKLFNTLFIEPFKSGQDYYIKPIYRSRRVKYSTRKFLVCFVLIIPTYILKQLIKVTNINFI